MCKAHAIVNDCFIFRDTFLFVKEVEPVNTQFLILVVEVPAPEPHLVIFSKYVVP